MRTLAEPTEMFEGWYGCDYCNFEASMEIMFEHEDAHQEEMELE